MAWSQVLARPARFRFHASACLLFLTVGFTLLVWDGMAMPVHAQEEGAPEAQRYENVDWHSVELIDFKAGKTGRAMEIIGDHFVPASEQAGTQVPRTVELQTGRWDLIFIWTMEEGPSEMTWETSPEDAGWQRTLAEIAGSEEEAENLLDEYQSLIARETSYVGFSGRHARAIAEQ
jgi:hypothetical protein